MSQSQRNPLSINDTLTTSEREPISDWAANQIEAFRAAMAEGMSPRERVVAFQVLTDYFCPHCGIDQPYGDCQCSKR